VRDSADVRRYFPFKAGKTDPARDAAREQVQTLLDRASHRDGYTLTVSLKESTIRDEQGFATTFAIDPFEGIACWRGWTILG